MRVAYSTSKPWFLPQAFSSAWSRLWPCTDRFGYLEQAVCNPLRLEVVFSNGPSLDHRQITDFLGQEEDSGHKHFAIFVALTPYQALKERENPVGHAY